MSSKLDELPSRVFDRVLELGCTRATVNVSINGDLFVERIPYPQAPQAAG